MLLRNNSCLEIKQYQYFTLHNSFNLANVSKIEVGRKFLTSVLCPTLWIGVILGRKENSRFKGTIEDDVER